MSPVWLELHLASGEPLRVTSYGVLAILGAALACWLCVASARRGGFPAFDAFGASVIGIAVGLIGARVLYLAVNASRIPEVGWLVYLSQGGLVWYGGLAGGAAAVLLFLRGYRLDVRAFADIAAPALAVGHGVGRVGCFLAGCCWGKPTSLPWGVRFPESPFFQGPAGVSLHPVQLYEAGAELCLAAIAWRLSGKVRKGGAFAIWLGGYGVVRLVLELFFRGDDRGVGLFGQPPSVALSTVAILLGVGLWSRGSLTTEKIAS
jgi:phosphatidylglycerol:prolipoprotein diacylglycerol transferase